MLSARISIITACLNAAQTIEQTIISVLDQKYPNLEYVVIDGGSSDGTMGVVNKYRKYLAYVASESDSGIYDAFNKGLSYATGDLIGILNADDFYAPWTFSTITKAYEENNDCDLLYGKIVVADEKAQKWTIYPLGNPEHLYGDMSLHHPAIFLPKKTYDKFGYFDESFKIAGDWDFILRLYSAGAAFCPVNEVLTAFRASGISSDYSFRQVKECMRIRSRYLNKLSATKKNTIALIKHMLRSILKGTNTYDWYAQYRNKKFSRNMVLESGALKGDSLWEAMSRAHGIFEEHHN